MWDSHSIQLLTVNYRKLSVEANPSYDSESKAKSPKEEEENSFLMRTANTEFNDDNNTVGVMVSILVGIDKEGNNLEDSEFWLEVVMEGIFEVDTETFDPKMIDSWASKNAPLTLYPYAREAAFSLTSRMMNNTAVVLPLLTVPVVTK